MAASRTGSASPPGSSAMPRWWSTSNMAKRCQPRPDSPASWSPVPARWSPNVATGANARAAWLRDAAHAGVPLFGICYGHQLLAHALGGEVGDNPNGREMGTIDLELHPHAADDPLFAGLPMQFPAQATHLQSVLRARQARRCWRSRRRTPATRSAGASTPGACSSIRNSARCTCAATCRPSEEALAHEGRCSRRLSREVSAAPHARRVLRRFVRHARALGRHH